MSEPRIKVLMRIDVAGRLPVPVWCVIDQDTGRPLAEFRAKSTDRADSRKAQKKAEDFAKKAIAERRALGSRLAAWKGEDKNNGPT